MAETPRRDEAQPAPRTANPADPVISDLPELVKADEAEKVRGGLNPQPLPPKILPK